MLAKRALHQTVQFLFGGIQGPAVRWAERQTQVRIRSYLPPAPFQPLAWRKFFDAVDQGPRTRHVIQREVTIQALKADAAFNCRVSENGFEFRAEEKVFALTADIQRLNTHRV